MSEQKTISAFYEQNHDRLDELFKTFTAMASMGTRPEDRNWQPTQPHSLLNSILHQLTCAIPTCYD